MPWYDGPMRVTIGERLGITKRKVARGTTAPLPSNTSDDGVPLWVEPEKVLRLAELPSARTVPVEVVPETSDDPGPRRVRGEMVWLHKTAPVLVIEGRRLSPEDHAAGRRR